MMNTFKVVLAAFSLSVLAADAAEKPLRQDRPNIIMVLIDDPRQLHPRLVRVTA